MINFCVEPEKHCHRNPIRELDLKVDRYYSSIYCRLCKHINDTVVHITQEERDEWNNKASKEALKDIQDQLNEITVDGSNSIKQEILLEVTKQIAEAIADLNLGEYAKKKYVDDAIKSIELDGYVTKEYADSTYLKIANYTKFDADSYYTKAEIQNMLKNSDIVKDYSISEFTIEDNKLILVQKNGGGFEIALSDSGDGNGVDVSYIQDQLKNYIKKGTLSKLIINGKIFSIENGSDIEIPVGGGGSNVDPTKYGYYKSYFKETSSKGQTPSKPIANRPPEDGSGWVENAPNYRDGYYIWMTQVFINGNGQYGEYLNPICLTGSGTAGEDGSGVSFIYKTAIEGEEINSPGTVSVENGVPVVPSGWTDHPSGVTKDVPYEYCSVVISNKGQWGSYWSQPFVWSHFGQNGMDGDGVEYIYYASTFAPSNNLPSTWTDDEDFQNREYIRENSGWTDDPQDLEELGAGYKQYVCVRKKYADTDGQAAYWHAYSDPALWGYYARDGVVSGIILDVVGEIKYLYVDNDYNNLEYNGESTITMYNDDSPVQFDLTIDSVKGSDGSYLSEQDIESYFSTTNNGNNKILNINIPANKLHFIDNTYYIVNVVGTPTSSSIDSQRRTAQIQLYGIKQGGQNGVSYDLKVSAAAINKIANQIYVKELSSEEVVIMDGDTIVAGMTSSKAIDSKSDLNGIVDNKGDVRIWAGEMQTIGDLTTAPFTVSSKGVVTSGNSNKIILNNGTIYFVVDGKIWHLGITNGKPDWISNEHPITNAYFYNVKNSNGYPVLSSTQMIYDNTDEVYYSDYASKRLASGTYLEIMINGSVNDYGVLCDTSLGQFVASAHLYQSCTFVNGVKTSNDEYFVIGDNWGDNGSSIIYNRNVQVYYNVGSSGSCPAANTIINNDGGTKWPNCDFAPGSDIVYWANKTTHSVSYTSSSTMPSLIGLDPDGETQIIVTTFLSSNTLSSKKNDFIGLDNFDK